MNNNNIYIIYLLKCFLNAPLTQYNATGFAQLLANDRQKPIIRSTCQNALYSSLDRGLEL